MTLGCPLARTGETPAGSEGGGVLLRGRSVETDLILVPSILQPFETCLKALWRIDIAVDPIPFHRTATLLMFKGGGDPTPLWQ